MLLRAVGIMLAVNVLVALWFYFSPTLDFGKTASAHLIQQPTHVAAGKLSPFESSTQNSRPKPLKLPVRIEPALVTVQ